MARTPRIERNSWNVFGLATDGNTVIYERAGSVNVNRWCGGVMLAFGALIRGLPARATRARAGA